jgi:hypothetical protein
MYLEVHKALLHVRADAATADAQLAVSHVQEGSFTPDEEL